MEQVKDNWYYCPTGHKTGQRVEKNSNIENTPIWCKHCKWQGEIYCHTGHRPYYRGVKFRLQVQWFQR